MRRPELKQVAFNFLTTFLVVTLLNNDRLFSGHCPRSSSVWALYVALSSRTLPLRQRIRHFTTNNALSGPLYTVLEPVYPLSPDRWFGSGLRRFCPKIRALTGISEIAVSTHAHNTFCQNTDRLSLIAEIGLSFVNF